jgi:hypothetical protein
MRISRAAGLIASAGAVLMPVSLFLHWYEVPEGATGDNARFTVQGWDAFESTDALMVVAAVVTLVLVVTAGGRLGKSLILIGAPTTAFIAVQLVDRPATLGFLDRSHLSLEVGAWLGLSGALLIVAAGVLAARVGEG